MAIEPIHRDEECSYPPSEAELRAFYTSWEWLQLAYEVKLANQWRCQACGRDKSDGARIVADHIRPARFYWHLRLDPENVQVLCEEDNRGKASWDQTDYRADTKGQLVDAIKKFREPLRPQQLKDAITTAYGFGAISQETAMELIREFRLVDQ